MAPLLRMARGPSTGTLGTTDPTMSGGADEALVYHGPGRRGWDTVPGPTIIDPTDVVVRIDSALGDTMSA